MVNNKVIKPIIVDNWKLYYDGTTWKNTYGDEFQIVEYINSTNVKIKFLDWFGYECIAPLNSIKSGYVWNPYHRFKYGQYYGVGPYSRKTHGKIYDNWKNMIMRVYDMEYKYHYNNCSVCNEWMNFQNFAKWYDEYRSKINPEYYHTLQIDKDILQLGLVQKIYSPETCCLIPSKLNAEIASLTVTREVNRDLPRCVYRVDTVSEKYNSMIQYSKTERVYLGLYDTPMEAFMVYKEAKEKRIKEMVQKYYNDGAILENIYITLMNIDVGPFDIKIKERF